MRTSLDERSRLVSVDRASEALGKLHVVPVRIEDRKTSSLPEIFFRMFEIVVAATGLLVGLPFILLSAVLIRLDSPGPIFFFHKRPARSVMKRGRELRDRTDLLPPPDGYDPDALYYVPSYFTLVKLRTMYEDARSRFPELYAYDFAPDEFRLKYPTLRQDPRVTRVGQVLRTFSVDELPNFWSVLVGDMRLVGPRPEAPEVLRYYTSEEMYKFAYKPGITGLAQVNGRGFLNWGETIAWDLQFARTRTIALDLKIIALTLRQVIFRRGAF